MSTHLNLHIFPLHRKSAYTCFTFNDSNTFMSRIREISIINVICPFYTTWYSFFIALARQQANKMPIIYKKKKTKLKSYIHRINNDVLIFEISIKVVSANKKQGLRMQTLGCCSFCTQTRTMMQMAKKM